MIKRAEVLMDQAATGGGMAGVITLILVLDVRTSRLLRNTVVKRATQRTFDSP